MLIVAFTAIVLLVSTTFIHYEALNFLNSFVRRFRTHRNSLLFDNIHIQ